MTVKAILSQKGRNVVTIHPTRTLAEAADILTRHGIGALIVRAEKGVDGILSERDIVRAAAKFGSAALARPVEDVMTRRVVSCSERDTVGNLMEMMTDGKFRHLPVLEDGELTGIVSIGDIVKYRLAEIEREQNALREYILTA